MIREKILTWNTKELLAGNGKTLILGIPSLIFFVENPSSTLPTPNKGEFTPLDTEGYRHIWRCQDLDWSNAFSGTTASAPVLIQWGQNTNTILNTANMFKDCLWLHQFYLGGSGYSGNNFHNVVDSHSMFSGCRNLHSPALVDFSSALENCAEMYYNCESFVNTVEQYRALAECNPRNHERCFTGCTEGMEHIPASWGGYGNG